MNVHKESSSQANTFWRFRNVQSAQCRSGANRKCVATRFAFWGARKKIGVNCASVILIGSFGWFL
ncbi:hypothetical protein O59_001182 [Cellvibrio sp. BR]|nr:hypothetical protein O59_001182 [Cellvibrio sp. BR]